MSYKEDSENSFELACIEENICIVQYKIDQLPIDVKFDFGV